MTTGHQPISAWLIGGDSLLIECGELLLAAGYDLHGVVTSNPRLAEWARGKNLPVVDAGTDYPAVMRERSFDFLFSITHLAVIPEAALRQPRRFAVNFHDGPLPKYAGLNTPAWALMRSEATYGITWHVITSELDRGDILKQSLFDVSPRETSLTMNTRCFEVAIDTFEQLVRELAEGRETRTPQPRDEFNYYSRTQRPVAACALDWSRPATELDALVRALDFGRYTNPIGAPKVFHASTVVAVTSATARPSTAAAAPGTILSVSGSEAVVRAGDGALAITGFSSLCGAPFSVAHAMDRLGLRVGDRFDVLTPEFAERLTELGAACAKSEPAWVKRLTTLEAADIPFRAGDGSGTGFGQIEMAIPSSFRERYGARGLADALTAAFGAFLWRCGEKMVFDIAFRDDALRTLSSGVKAWIASRVPLRVSLDGAEPVHKALDRMHDEMSLVRKRGGFLRDTVARHVELHNRHDLFDLASLSAGVEQVESLGGAMAPVHPLTLVVSADGKACRLDFDRSTISPEAAQQIRDRFGVFLERAATRADAPLAQVDVLSEDERTRVVVDWNKTATPYPADATIHRLFEAQAARTPDAPAVAFDGEQLTYRELNERANRLASHLRSLGVAPDSLVGIFIERSIELLVAVLATQKAGGAYVPLDPTYPRDRLAFMIEDARVPVILTSQSLAGELPPNRASVVRVDADWARIEKHPADNLPDSATASNLAYVIYTSGSTGKPKGVMIEHRNAVNFFTGMDERLPRQSTSGGPQDVWLAVTSLSFDISVLELLWTVTRGFKVVVYSDGTKRKTPQGAASRTPGQPVGHTPGQLGFSLFYFASDEGENTSERYTLLLEGARFADRNGFAAVWTPERHFHAFGGLYPNPAVASAAIAGITERVGIRAGSVVLPLHHPARIAEEWALVDNLSRGRVGIAFASGWQPVDFVLRPETYASRHVVLYDGIETVRKLWRGELIEFPGPDGKQHAIRTLPRPIQPELPVWVTTAGNIDTWKSAGKVGAHILTHLLGQTVEEVAAKVKAYREARKEAGHPGDGIVTMMLHTFVGDGVDEVREIVRKPMKDYLASSISLVKNVASSWAALKKRSDGTQAAAAPDISSLSAEEMDGLLDFSFERYFETSGLFGTPQTCLALVNRLREIGIDEIACLIDFGVPSQLALDHLRHLNQLRALACPEAGHISASESAASRETSIGALIRRHGVTHIQCTPSMAGMILADDDSRDALKTVRVMMIGGEAFPTALATDLAGATRAKIINMYGPTETTIWSSTQVVAPGAAIPIGRPIANTTLYIVDRHMRPTPVGVPGELLIGGAGVARGYLNRPELTAERFIQDPFSSDPDSRLYRTGDVARYLPDGVVEFLGRGDHQVKIRGYRIELGEIESALSKHPGVKEAVVVPREDTPGDKRLVAYFIPAGDAPGSMELRTFMRERLPEFMVPSIFFAMKSFPQTPNRKVDRKSLPSPIEPKVARPAAGAAVALVGAPAGEFEQRIIRVWEDVLGLKTVGMDDNFFDLGGHSLLAVKAHRLLKEALQRDLAITDLFRFPTVRALAGHLTQRGGDDSMDRSGSRGESRRELLAARQSRLRGRGKSEDGA